MSLDAVKQPRRWAKKISALSMASLVSLAVLLSGCAATYTAVNKKDLEVVTRTSTAIFVDAVPREKRTIYLDVKSGIMEFDRREFKNFIKEQFTQFNDNGFQIIDDPERAQFQMTAYVMNLEQAKPNAAEAALGDGFSGAATTAVVSGAAVAGIANSTGSSDNRAAGLGLAVGAASFIADAMVKDVTYMLVVDIQIKEKTSNGAIVRKDTRIDTKVSDAGGSTQTVSEAGSLKEYRTRIVTTANKVNLTLEEAQPQMFKKTAYAMSGFF